MQQGIISPFCIFKRVRRLLSNFYSFAARVDTKGEFYER